MFYFKDMNSWGCPLCGFRSGRTPISQGPFAVWSCGECNKGCVIYCGDLPMPDTYNGSSEWGNSPIKLESHPRAGIPARGRADVRPEGGGEYFYPRGLGKDYCPGCFVCGGEEGLYNNVAAFVNTREAGERVLALFDNKGVRLDYREHSPDRIQVKLGACEDHINNLEAISHLRKVITADDIKRARVIHVDVREAGW